MADNDQEIIKYYTQYIIGGIVDSITECVQYEQKNSIQKEFSFLTINIQNIDKLKKKVEKEIIGLHKQRAQLDTELEQYVLNRDNLSENDIGFIRGATELQKRKIIGKIRYANELYAFILILNGDYGDYSDTELIDMFHCVYNSLIVDYNKEYIVNSIRDTVMELLDLAIKPDFRCVLRDRVHTGQKSISKSKLKTRQHWCIGSILTEVNKITENDTTLKQTIEQLKDNISELTTEEKRKLLIGFVNKTASNSERGKDKKLVEQIDQKILSQYIYDIFQEIDEEAGVIYRILETNQDGLCKSIDDIDFSNISVKIGLDINTFRFVIFRWGRWREFDPLNYVIKVDITNNNDLEIGINPFRISQNKPYERAPKYYHTILRKLGQKCDCTIMCNHDETVFYYSIIYRSFFRESDCNPVKIYSRVKNEKAGCETLKKLIDCNRLKLEFNNNSVFKTAVMIRILQGQKGDKHSNCNNLEEFLFPFVEEFYGAMDELHKNGQINIVEKMIFDDDDTERRRTIENYSDQSESILEHQRLESKRPVLAARAHPDEIDEKTETHQNNSIKKKNGQTTKPTIRSARVKGVPIKSANVESVFGKKK